MDLRLRVGGGGVLFEKRWAFLYHTLTWSGDKKTRHTCTGLGSQTKVSLDEIHSHCAKLVVLST